VTHLSRAQAPAVVAQRRAARQRSLDRKREREAAQLAAEINIDGRRWRIA
jgi:hypothetical protein